MEETLLKSLEHAPELLAMVIIVVVFVKFNYYILGLQCEKDKEYAKTIAGIVEKHSTAEQKSNESREILATEIRQNSRATEHLTTAMEKFTCKYQLKR